MRNNRVCFASVVCVFMGAMSHAAWQADQATLSFDADQPTGVAPYGLTYHVSTNGSDSADGLSWGAAFRTIHHAISVATHGDSIIVGDGTFVNAAQLIVGKGLTLTSLNGPLYTAIDGNNAYMGVVVSNINAVVSGFTVKRGSGSWGFNVVVSGGGTVTNCHLINCKAQDGEGGGGAMLGGNAMLVDCVITNNLGGKRGPGVLVYAGGNYIYKGTNNVIRNCLIAGNHNPSATQSGGGICSWSGDARIESCTVMYNSGPNCGGIDRTSGTLHVVNCVVLHNETKKGMADEANIRNLTSCTYSCTLAPSGLGTGCINTNDAVLEADGTGAYKLSFASACVDAGSSLGWMAGAKDLWGNPRITGGTADMGCHEYVSAGALDCIFSQSASTAPTGSSVSFTAQVYGAGVSETTFKWDFENDGTYDETINGSATVSHAFSNGTYSVRLRVEADGDYSEYLSPACLFVAPGMTYVVPVNANAAAPFDTWETAATKMSDAIGAVVDGGTVMVADGTYKPGATTTISKKLTLKSVNGAAATIIDGNTTVARLFQTALDGIVIDGFTIMRSNGGQGGGVQLNGGTVRNCVFTLCNAASRSPAALLNPGRLVNCIITNCTSTSQGGTVEVWSGTTNTSQIVNCLVADNKNTNLSNNFGGAIHKNAGNVLIMNCTVVSNIINQSGKYAGINNATAAADAVRNCVVAFNYYVSGSTYTEMNVANSGNIQYCVIYPTALNFAAFAGCKVADPLFRNIATGNYRLMPASPCINACINYLGWWKSGDRDLAGAPRVNGKAVDIGCYEAAVSQTLLYIR